jgi:HD-GYP domain-containing protein (c-di-GMP phosphodiesterase class II)
MRRKQARTGIREGLLYRIASIYAPALERLVRHNTKKEINRVQRNGQGVSSLVKACSERLSDRSKKEKWHYTRKHSFDVGLFSYIIANEIIAATNRNGVDPRICFAGGFAHDNGKTFLPMALLIKELGIDFLLFCQLKTRMSDNERRVIRKEHLVAGSEFVGLFGDSENMETMLDMVRLHHVTYNGFDSTHPSYPEAIQGSALPIHARIAKTADFLSAVMPRHYRKNTFVHTFDDALAYAIAVAGSELDPLTVKCFISGTHDVSFLDADMLVDTLKHPGLQIDISDYKKIGLYVKNVVQCNADFWQIMNQRSLKKMKKWIYEICKYAKELRVPMIEDLAREQI